MCTSSIGKKVTKTIHENPLVGVGSSKPAVLKIGGRGSSVIGVGNKGGGFIQAGGRGEKGAPLAVGRIGGSSLQQIGGKGNTLMGGTSDKGFQYAGLRTTSFGLKSNTAAAAPPKITEPPKRDKSSELAVKDAAKAQRRKLGLLGLRKFLLTSGRGAKGSPTLGKKGLLGF